MKREPILSKDFTDHLATLFWELVYWPRDLARAARANWWKLLLLVCAGAVSVMPFVGLYFLTYSAPMIVIALLFVFAIIGKD